MLYRNCQVFCTLYRDSPKTKKGMEPQIGRAVAGTQMRLKGTLPAITCEYYILKKFRIYLF